MRLSLIKMAGILGTVALSFEVNATTITASNGQGGSASADISLSGSTLTIDLKNTGEAPHGGVDVLTALLFNLPTGVTLTPVSAVLGSGSVTYGTGNPGDGWTYSGAISVLGKNSGISAFGGGVFGNPNFSATPHLPLDGMDYGIVNGDPTSWNGGKLPLFSNEVDFTLTVGGTGSIDSTALDNSLLFIWGTATLPNTEGSGGPSVPDGGTTILLFGMGLIGLACFARSQKVSLERVKA